MQEFLEIGQIVNTFGIKGMVKIKPFTDDINRFDYLEKIYIEKNNTKKEYEIEEVKYHKGMVLMKLKGVNTPEEAELLRNYYLKVKREDEPELEEGTYYIVDLIGLDVCLAIMDVLYNETGDTKYRSSSILRKYVRAGWLGRKSGRGFYNYNA